MQYASADILLVAFSAFEVNMTSHSQVITLKQFQQQMAVPPNKKIFLIFKKKHDI